jgi:hypothetical protein
MSVVVVFDLLIFQCQKVSLDSSIFFSLIDEKNIAMSNDKNFSRKGEFSGPLFELDHLATFTVGSKQGFSFC